MMSDLHAALKFSRSPYRGWLFKESASRWGCRSVRHARCAVAVSAHASGRTGSAGKGASFPAPLPTGFLGCPLRRLCLACRKGSAAGPGAGVTGDIPSAKILS